MPMRCQVGTRWELHWQMGTGALSKRGTLFCAGDTCLRPGDKKRPLFACPPVPGLKGHRLLPLFASVQFRGWNATAFVLSGLILPPPNIFTSEMSKFFFQFYLF